MIPPLHVVLVTPEIPGNTGTVGRLCVATGARLHLVEPLGFSIDEKAVRRAGLDYWKHVDLAVHRDWQACKRAIPTPPDRWAFLSTHAERPYTSVAWRHGDVVVFGKETAGLGPALLSEAGSRACTIPFSGPVRSLNLSTAVGVVVYEALRQMRPHVLPPPAE